MTESAERMRILHVTETYATGVARAILGIAQHSPQHDHLLLYSGWEDPPTSSPFAESFRLPKNQLARIRAVRQKARTAKVDVVHLHSSWAGLFGRVLPLRDVRVVYQPHCFAFEDLSRTRWQRQSFWLVERLLGLRTDVVLAVSERERLLAEAVAPRAEAIIVANRSLLEPLDERPVAQAVRRTVVMSGEIRSQKDPEMFAAVAESCAASGLEVDFVWLGTGDAESRACLERSAVRVTGWLDSDGVREELDRAALYLHTARYEGFPLSVLDAAARLVPTYVRHSPAFEGLGLISFRNVEEAVARVREVIEGDSEGATQNARRIRMLFDPATIPFAIERAYSWEMTGEGNRGGSQ